MNKCPKCDSEFEGNFCPNCGEKFEQEKTCPQCGTKLPGSARFCNECGYSFTGESAKPKNAYQPENQLEKIYGIFKIVPTAIFALFTVLLFIFAATPVAELILGMGFPNESLGNVYTMSSGVLLDIPKAQTALTAFIIAMVISAIFMCVICAVSILPKYKYREIKGIRMPILLTHITWAIYLLMLVFGIAIVAEIIAADEGMDLIAVGAFPILLIVFSVAFAAISAGSVFFAKTLLAKNPKFADEENQKMQAYIEAEKQRKERFYATHTAPIAPKTIEVGLLGEKSRRIKGTKKAEIVYKHAKRRYDNAKEGDTSAAIIWIDIYKYYILLLISLLIVATIASVMLISSLTDKFKLSKVEKIELGFTQEQVVEILGEPYEVTKTDMKWQYYDSKYNSILKDIDKNNKQQEAALESGNEEKLLKLMTAEENLKYKFGEIVDNYIEIQFDGNKQVTAVIFDTAHCEAEGANIKKSIKEITLLNNNVLRYSDIAFINIKGKFYYEDGSYKLTILPMSAYSTLNTEESGIKEISWSDEYGDYNSRIEIVSSINGTDNNVDWRIYLVYSDYDSVDDEKKRQLALSLLGSGEISKNAAWNSYFQMINYIIISKEISNLQCDVLNFPNIQAVFYATITNSTKTDADSSATTLEDTKNSQTITAELIIPDGVTEISEGVDKVARDLASITNTSITIPESVVTIGDFSFSSCSALTEINFNATAMNDLENYVYINRFPFHDAGTSDITVNIGANVTKIPARLFFDSDNIKSVIFADNSKCKSIGGGAFAGCTSLTSITIPDSVTSIGEGAFGGCYKLVEIYNLSSLSITAGSSDNGYVVEYALNVYTPTNGTSKLDTTDDGYIFYADGSTVCLMGYVGNDTVLTLPSDYKGSDYEIYKYAFYNCDSLVSITIPDGFTSIDDGAFGNCTSLTSITIPDSVTSIGEYAFYDCTSLTSITIPDSVTSIGGYAFAYCYSLASVTIGEDSMLESIGSYAFYRCTSLTSITLPYDMRIIDSSAFENCTSLTSITFADTTTWYCSGREMDVTNTSNNVIYFTKTYKNSAWYKI